MRPFVLLSLIIPCLSQVAHAERWTGADSPLDGHRLVVLRPSTFTLKADAVGVPHAVPELVKHRGAVWGSVVSLKQPVRAEVVIKAAGQYSMWVRIAQISKFPSAIQADITAGDRTLLHTTFGNSTGSESTGGPVGFAAYRKLVEQFSTKIAATEKPGGIGDDLLNELANSKDQARRKWANLNRVEDSSQQAPFYWWKLPSVALKPGTYSLALATSGRVRDEPPLVDAAFLTTFGDLPYPFHGDIDARPASYVRFHIESLPPEKTNLGIRLGAQLHHMPWGASANLAPNGINNSKPAEHSKPGFTRWYRLQDIENFSGFGGATLSIALNIDPAAKGTTEFAVFPHDDFVLRRFDWNEPDGKRLSMRTDFQTYPQDLRTLRDYAREHYQTALWATGNQLFPLTRGPLYFANGSGGDSGAGNDYLVKTLRLLGFNSCAAPDNVNNSRRYGWQRVGGHYWPPVWMPYDEAAAAGKYREHYAKDVDRRQSAYEGLGTFQIADEPGEINTTELSAPLWLYRPAAGKDAAHWHDPTGASELVTKSSDLGDCVLEGILHCGNAFELRVGQLAGDKPNFGFWRVGRPRNDVTFNLTSGVSGRQSGTLTRPGAVPSWNGVPFKIVYQSGQNDAKSKSTSDSKTATAALYVNNRMMTQLNGLPAKGGFVIRGGNAKSISQLKLRAIGKEEQLLASVVTPGRKKADPLVDDLLNEIKSGGSGKSKYTAKPLKEFVEQDWVWSGGLPDAHVGFRKWLRSRGVTPQDAGADSWANVRVMTILSVADTPARRRQYYWSRRYANYLTPRMFAMAAEGIRAAAPNKELKGYVALSGHALYLGSTAMPLDMFELARYPALTPGVSDWMSSGGWRWDSHQAVAYSVAPYNAGARQYGKPPLTFPMMHCVYPSVFRAYTQVANQCKLLSYWTYGPSYSMTEGYWSDNPWSHHAVHKLNNRSAQVDDILGTAVMRPSRVAMLYSHATHVWSSADSYHDKRATFLGLSHEYYQPELVTEEQIADGCLQHYDALYVLEPHVSRSVQDRIAAWTRGGGLLWTSSNSLSHDEYNEPHDWLSREAAIQRTGRSDQRSATMKPNVGQPTFQSHAVQFGHRYETVAADNAVTRATYDDGSAAWIEKPLGKGRVVYVGHRAGVTYSAQSVAIGGRPVIWANTGRATLTRPLHEAAVARELVLSKPTVMATAQSTDQGTVIVLYNMRPEVLTSLKITLAEPTRPAVVQAFQDDRLSDLPFEFAAGTLTITLDRLALNEGQMIIVRRNPRPVDSRLEAMQTRATRLLASDDPLDLSAGAWLAGFLSHQQLGEPIMSLLDHPRWEVRRSAAEALGRLNHKPAADRLARVIQIEPDTHVRADAIHALALIDPASFVQVAKAAAQHESMIVRLETMRAVKSLLDRASNAAATDAPVPNDAALAVVAASCLADDSQPIRNLAIELCGRLQPDTLIPKVLDAATTPHDRTQWAIAIAKHETAFAQYLERGMPGGDDVLFTIAQNRSNPELARELDRRFTTGERQPRLMNAIEAQRNEPLMRRVFEHRDQLDRTWQARLAYQLETSIGYGLGRDLDAWAARLVQSGTQSP
ncbi:MAG: HEAT repeat domain-containing protein [Planctomycetota bacterium]|nr:HEAT repeat domain-containing protein [Planctomycetota bacterium]